jgi:hypothetical protein
MDSASVVGWVAALKNAIEVVRGVKDLLPKAQQEVVTQSLEEADRQARLAEVEIAKTSVQAVPVHLPAADHVAHTQAEQGCGRGRMPALSLHRDREEWVNKARQDERGLLPRA